MVGMISNFMKKIILLSIRLSYVSLRSQRFSIQWIRHHSITEILIDPIQPDVNQGWSAAT